MRILPSDEHQLRKERILQAVIHLYIRTGKPVGSTAIGESFNLGLSSASIRNVLAELEKDGYLTHPHTSAGRIPTDLGYRFYVDSIAKVQRLAEEERRRIETQYARRMQELEDFLQSTTRILSTLSHCAGFAMRPRIGEERLRRIDLLPVNQNQLLGVLISESGMVRNQMIPVTQVPDDKSLRDASAFLTEQLKGVSFGQAQQRLVSELDRFHGKQAQQDELMETVSQHLFETGDQSSVFVDGTSNMFDFPEFHDLGRMRNFASLVDKKETLAHVLNTELNKKGVQVRIGVESIPELKDFSLVSSTYEVRGRPLGVLGILGPKRMEYERMMSIVTTVTDLVNRFLDQNEKDLLEDQSK